MKSKELIPIQSQEFINKSLEFCNSITEIKIETTTEYLNANEMTARVRAYIKNLNNDRKAITKPYKEKVDEINVIYKEPIQALKNIDERLGDSLGKYEQEQERKRLEAQRKADKEAQKERDRLATEAQKENEKSQEAAEKGKETQAQKHHEKAQVKQQLAETIETPTIEPVTPKVKDMYFRSDWKAEVIDRRAFIEHCLQICELSFLEINMQKLDKIAQTSKGKIVLPGIKFNCKKTPVYRKQ